jgi:outer membrane protein TolC
LVALLFMLAGDLSGAAPGILPADTVESRTLTLSAALQLALARHPSLVLADAAVESAASGVRAASSERLPLLSTDASFMRFAEPMVTAPLHGFNPLQPPSFDRTLFQGGISLGYTLFDGGARGARLSRAEALTAAGEAGAAGARLSLLSDLVRAYLRVLTTADLLDANAHRVGALEGERDRALQLLERGTAARVQVLRAEAALGAARADWYAALGERDLAVGDLARLTGLDPARLADMVLVPVRPGAGAFDTAFNPRASVSVHSAPGAGPAALRASSAPPPLSSSTSDRERLLERALAANPEVARLRRLLAAAEASRGEARSLWFPTVQAVGRYAEYGSRLGREQGEWQGGLQLSFPLFTNGARQAAGDRAAAEVRSARAQLELVRLAISSALDRALAAVEAEHARAEALHLAEAQATEVARIERLALDAGAGVQTDYLTAEAELLRVRAAWLAARAAETGARVELARVLGELSIEWLERNLESGS